MVVPVALGLIGAGAGSLYLTGQTSDAYANPRVGLRAGAKIAVLVGGLLLLGWLVVSLGTGLAGLV